MTTGTATKWTLKGKGFEFCNCDPGCSCNFSGFPSSSDGSCKALVAAAIDQGHCGDVELSGVTAVALIDWPKAIHDGNGKVVFVVPPRVSDAQVGALAQIFTGQLGGLPWSILGTTYEVAGLVRAEVQVRENGMHSSISIPGVGAAQGTTMKNPVTGEDHLAAIVLDTGFMWKQGDCGQGSFEAKAEGLSMKFENSNWILYDFDWTN